MKPEIWATSWRHDLSIFFICSIHLSYTFQMVRKSLLMSHQRQTLQKLMWFGIPRGKTSPVRDTKPAPGCLLGKLQLDCQLTPFPLQALIQGPQHTLGVQSDNRGPVLSYWDESRCEFSTFLVLCPPLSCCRARCWVSNSLPNQGRAKDKASSTENCNKSFPENFSFSLKTMRFWFPDKHYFLTPSWTFSIGNLHLKYIFKWYYLI